MAVIRKCKFCGKEFTRRANNHTYCSLECRDAFKEQERALSGRKKSVPQPCAPRVTMNEVLQFAEEYCRRTGHYPHYGEAVKLMEGTR